MDKMPKLAVEEGEDMSELERLMWLLGRSERLQLRLDRWRWRA